MFTLPPSTTKAPRLLLVEDHRDTGAVFQRILQQEGYDVVLTTSVKSAIALFDMTYFDILISDMGLPDGSGLDVMRHVLKERPIPAIAVSALCGDEDIQRSLDAGFRAHLAKPIDLARLKTLLARITGKP